ncbi:MAG: LytR C-terminal domain-containing protein, partial [Candidatus Eisenbacteria bacterium]
LGGSAAWRWWGPGARAPHVALPHAAAPQAPRDPRPDAPVRIEVLNGSGEPGAAGKLASYLREGGFNVVLVGSADRYDYLRTLVVARTEDGRPSSAVVRYLGDVGRVTQRARSEADVTVVVGKDRGRSPWGEGKDPNGRG